VRFEVDIEIGGTALADAEHGTGELARVLLDLATKVEDCRLAEVGDEVVLRDYNGFTAGRARLVPDWTVGEEVWATTHLTEGPVKAVITSVTGSGSLFMVRVRNHHTSEPLGHVLVDHWGMSDGGQPLLGRVR
jgi:hypothetical protein